MYDRGVEFDRLKDETSEKEAPIPGPMRIGIRPSVSEVVNNLQRWWREIRRGNFTGIVEIGDKLTGLEDE